ncbi:Vacuolar protein sorting-associate Vta1 N-terminal [Penicillium cosmopolitanum]|uniref:Vacuolar protein sorting-associate Vta1 N-terminal n=1 Tax=Penicillium cosmopolitanum TaxID=1131564 RepID=A0A9W9VM42_9EURO|nr:Vacuolar protein sorting-associate Vta1 N-terminal [Penicillium cosmopolitanum]KAJ5385646.1 Vacuolar protein sorting-associate Vta1 N-terminal [Penicillium cosmopolitanum]
MATIIPVEVRSTKIGLFALRAAQIEKTKPNVVFIISMMKLKYTPTNLVDKLEQVRRVPQLDPLPALYMTDNYRD